jgi:hypothetical protein
MSVNIDPKDKQVWLQSARSTLECEAKTILRAAGRLDASLSHAIELLLSHAGKLIITYQVPRHLQPGHLNLS